MTNPFNTPNYALDSPAGFPQIAYRVGCDQLIAVERDNYTDYFQSMPDGDLILLTTYPTMDQTQAFLYLSGEGLCKVLPEGHPQIPSMYTSQLPLQAQIEASEVSVSPNPNTSVNEVPGVSTWHIGLGVVGLVVLFILLNLKPKTVNPRERLNLVKFKNHLEDE